MTQLELLQEEKEKRHRTSLMQEALRQENTYGFIVFEKKIHVEYRTPDLPGHKLGKSKVRFRRESNSRSRYTVWVFLYRLAFSQVTLMRKYMLRLNRPTGPFMVADISLSTFPLILSNYDKWASRKIQSYLRLPWALSAKRVNPETRSLILTEGWVEGGTVRSFSQTPYTSYSRSYQGTVTPNFRKLKKSQLPDNNYSLLLFHKGNYGEYVHNVQRDTAGQLLRDDQYWWDFGIPGGDSEPVFNTSLYDRAVKRLATAAQSDVTSNVALNLAQIQLTIDMIGRSAQRISGSLRALKSGNFSGAAKILWRNQRARYGPNGGPKTGSSLASNWLELQYGWKPLLSDIRGSMEALARYNYANVAVQRVAVSATSKSINSERIGTNSNPSTTVGSLYRESRESCRFGLRFRLQSPLIAFLAQTGFTNPVNLAWELIPFSFVVDWFLPIGNYLETIGRWDGLEFLGGYQTNFIRKRTSGRTYFSGTYLHLDPSWHTDRYGAYSSMWVKHSRSQLSGFPGATLPELKNGLNVTRSLNALALMRVVFGK